MAVGAGAPAAPSVDFRSAPAGNRPVALATVFGL